MSRRISSVVVLFGWSLLPILALSAEQPPASKEASASKKESAKRESKSTPAKKSDDTIDRIKDEGLKRSQVMATLSYLTDVIGPRLTGSPGMKRANEWTRDKLKDWGLVNSHLEPWGPFGVGWSLERFSAQVVAPQCIPLIAYPKAWSPGTAGSAVVELVLFDAKAESDFSKFRGKLKGKIVLTGPTRSVSARFEPLATRLSEKELLALADAAPSSGNRRGIGFDPRRAERELARKRLKFLMDEGAIMTLEASAEGDGGTLFVAAAALPGTAAPPASSEPGPANADRGPSPWQKDAPKTLPQVVVAKEHFNRLVRMIQQGEALRVSVDLAVRFHDEDLMGYNTVAEIPGGDLKDELVMLGGHMDSWHSGTGATDNAAGIAVAMEAVRILKNLGVKPRRTIRIALWSGEEQGLLGSKAYVTEHFGKGEATKDSEKSKDGGSAKSEAAAKPEYAKFSVYFNLDNGTGKIRGVYLQGNESVRPIFREWLTPFRSMNASTLSAADTGGTDHLSFDSIGLPGFEFIQDAVEYHTRTHHSNQDVYDRLQADDLKQASVIMAAFVYNAATAEEKLPRKPRVSREPQSAPTP